MYLIPEIAMVIAKYEATASGQLDLEIGNLINVRQKSPRGWWEGELQVCQLILFLLLLIIKIFNFSNLQWYIWI